MVSSLKYSAILRPPPAELSPAFTIILACSFPELNPLQLITSLSDKFIFSAMRMHIKIFKLRKLMKYCVIIKLMLVTCKAINNLHD